MAASSIALDRYVIVANKLFQRSFSFQNNPTYEFFPSKGKPLNLSLLETTLPANLYPLTWLLPSDLLFIQTNRGTALLDYKRDKQFDLPDMPHA